MESVTKHLIGAGLTLGFIKLILVMFAVADAYYQSHHGAITGVAASTYAVLMAKELLYD